MDLGLCTKIDILARWEPGYEAVEIIDENRKIIRIKSTSTKRNKTSYNELLKYTSFLKSAQKFIRSRKYQFINVHSLHVLPIGVALKLKNGGALIYDAHELETEVAGSSGMKRILAKMAERLLIKFVDELIVVSPLIAEWYKKEYGIQKVTVIRNIPYNEALPAQHDNILKKEFNIPEGDILFLYQGVISEVRGCHKVLSVFKKLPENYHILFMGFGPMEHEIKSASEINLNIHYKSAVPSSEVKNYTRTADIGIHFINVDGILNHQYCLPNKFFEYLLNGLPVLVNSKAEEMAAIVNEHKVGFLIDTDEFNEEKIVEYIKSISKKAIKEAKENLHSYINSLGWEIEAVQYKKIYEKYLKEL